DHYQQRHDDAPDGQALALLAALAGLDQCDDAEDEAEGREQERQDKTGDRQSVGARLLRRTAVGRTTGRTAAVGTATGGSAAIGATTGWASVGRAAVLRRRGIAVLARGGIRRLWDSLSV